MHADIDDLQDELCAAQSVYHAMAKKINAAIGAEHVKVEATDGGSGSLHLAITSKRWAAAVASGALARAQVVGATFVDKYIAHPVIGPAANERIARASSALSAKLATKLSAFLEDLADAHAEDMRMIVRDISELDISCTCARNARDYNLTRPALCQEGSSGGRYFRAKGLRHPLIEASRTAAEPFVANDVSLGCDGLTGMLLYGVNAVGKSSIMKAVGIAVVMAQAGMYVAASM